MKVVNEKLILGVLGLLLAGAMGALFAKGDVAVWIARGICVVLTLIFLMGIWFPARKYLRRTARDSSNYPGPPEDKSSESG